MFVFASLIQKVKWI